MTTKPLRDMTSSELGLLLTTIAGVIDDGLQKVTGEKPSFVVLVFEEDGNTQYVSNCERASMVRALRETADRLDNGEENARVPFPDVVEQGNNKPDEQ